MSAITITDLENAALDVATIAEVANGDTTPGTLTSRLGTSLKTLSKLQEEMTTANDTATASAAAAAISEGNAETFAENAYLSQLAAQQAVAPRLYHSIRFHSENGEEASSGLNGQFRLIGCDNIFKTTVNYDTPFFNTTNEDAVIFFCSVPIERDKRFQRKPVVLGTTGETNPRSFNVGYEPDYTAANGNVGRFWIQMYDNVVSSSGNLGRTNGAWLPTDFSGKALVCVRRLGDTLAVDVWDCETAVKTAGTPVSFPVGWNGFARFGSDLTIGGKNSSTFPYDKDQVSGSRHEIYTWKSEVSDVLFAEGVITDLQMENLLGGADIATEIGSANFRLYCPLVSLGAIDLTTTSHRAALVTDFTQQGVVYPGSTLRKQSAAKYLTIDRVPYPCLMSREPTADFAYMPHSGTYTGLDGLLEAKIIDSEDYVVKDWHTVGNHTDFTGGIWEAVVHYPKWNKQVSIKFRFNSDIETVASINSPMFVGQACVFWSQSEGYYATANSANISGAPTALNITQDSPGCETVFMVGPAVAPAIRQTQFHPALLGDEFVTMQNLLRKRDSEPFFLILQTISGTSPLDLIDDDVLVSRQWDTEKVNWEMLGNRGPSGEVVVSGHIWGGWEAYASGDTVVPPVHFPPFFWGVASSTVAQADIDHYLYDGTFSLNAKRVVLPNNRAMTWASNTTDRSGEADQRKGFYDYAETYGYEIAPETTLHELEGTSGSQTHPKPNSLEGAVEMARAFGEAAAMCFGVSAYAGPARFTSAAFVSGSGNTQVDVTLTVPAFGPGGFLYTKGGGADYTGFEAKLSTAGAWAKSNITSAVWLNARTIRLTLSSAGTTGETLISYHSGAPGNYGSAGDAAWRAGGAMFNGYPVAGDNTAISVS